jgi:hypothetical protein
MLNHECDVTKLFEQVEALTAGQALALTEFDKRLEETDQLITGKRSINRMPKKTDVAKKKQLDTDLSEAKTKAKKAREKVIKTNQDILERMAKAKPTKAKKQTLTGQIASIIKDNGKMPPDELKQLIYNSTDTKATADIDAYLDARIESFRKVRTAKIKEKIKKQLNPTNKTNKSIENKLIEAVNKEGYDPSSLKRAFQQATGLTYLGDVDMKVYIDRINAAKKLDGYEQTLAMAVIQRDLSNEVPTLWSDAYINLVKTAILANPAGEMRDALGTLIEGNLLSGSKPTLPTLANMKKFYKEALLGINTAGMAGSSMADYTKTGSANVAFPAEWRKLQWLQPTIERFARISTGLRDAPAKAVYAQVYEASIEEGKRPNMTDAEAIALVEHAHMRASMATYSPFPDVVKTKGKEGYILAQTEKLITNSLSKFDELISKSERDKSNSRLHRLGVGIMRVVGNSTIPFGGFMVRLGFRSLNFTTAPLVALGSLSKLAYRAYTAKSLNRDDLGFTVDEVMHMDANFKRALYSTGNYALLVGLIEAGVLAFDDSEDDNEERRNRSVGLYAPQLNITQLASVLSGNIGRTVAENDVLLGLGAFPMTSIQIHLANAIRKGIKEDEMIRNISNGVVKAVNTAFFDTPANQTLSKLMRSRDEDGNPDASVGLAKAGENVATAIIPSVIKRPIQILITKPKTAKPKHAVPALPTVAKQGEVAPTIAKHQLEQQRANEWGEGAYYFWSVLNAIGNPMPAELQNHQKAMVAEYNRTHSGRGAKELDPLTVRYNKYVPNISKAGEPPQEAILPIGIAGKLAKKRRSDNAKEGRD